MLDRGLIPNSCHSRGPFWPTELLKVQGGARFGFYALPPSLSLSLGGFTVQERPQGPHLYIKARARLRPLTHCLPRFSSRNISPDLGHPAMVILRFSNKAGKTKPQAKSLKELVSRIGQRTANGTLVPAILLRRHFCVSIHYEKHYSSSMPWCQHSISALLWYDHYSGISIAPV